MEKNGFTLIELLGVIIILGILSLVTFPVVLNQIKNAKQGIKDSTKALIIDAAKDYYEDNSNNYDKVEGMTYCIGINTLTENNYLNKKIKDENLNDIDTNKKVKMVYHNGKFEYDVVDSCNNNSLTRNNIEISIVNEDSGLYKSTTDKDRFIYRGGTPNNWIELNEGTEETPNYVKYRIISFEYDGTIKVIRNEPLSDLVAWDEAGNRNEEVDTYCITASTNGCNVWGNKSNILFEGELIEGDFFNPYYTNSTTTELTKNCNGTITKDASLNTFLNPINSEQENKWNASLNLDKYIQVHSFNVGGIYYANGYTGLDKGIIKEKQEEGSLTWNGKIALPAITEFVESSTNSSCISVWSNTDSNTENTTNPCSSANWLLTINEVTLTSRPNTIANLWRISNSVTFKNSYTPKNSTAKVRPAFYLKPSISLTGEGSEVNPYRIVGES